ncbi:MAG: DUF4132 domain-containing protein, partial [Planctomycetaceae bacterium]|nr:DUF4132 domain-containing protein [Planctomycetaceae bacterium]
MAKAKKKVDAARADVPVSEDGAFWIEADKGYSIALIEGKLQSRNPKGAALASVPKWLKDSEQAQQLISLGEWLDEHEKQSRDTIEAWMLRSLPVPRSVLVAIWQDPSWKSILTNAVVCSVTGEKLNQQESGFLREVDAKKGAGVIDLDGETQWLKSDSIAIPHPILLDELDDFRALTIELSFQQSLDQLFRQTWKPTKEQLKGNAVEDFRNGKFEALTHALSLCRRLGYRVSGGSACSPVWENGRLTEGRFWVGAEYPEAETYTWDLIFTDDR